MQTPKITLEQWAALVAVVDEGSYSKAAELLEKSQSTVSYAISRIEEQLSGPVLRVEGRKAELTELGKVMVRKARKLLEEASGVESLAETINRGWEGEICVALDVVFPIEIFLDALDKFTQRAANTRVRLLETSLSGSDEALFSGQADIVISPSVPPGFIGHQLHTVVFRAVAHPDHPLNQLERPITQADLEQHRQVVVRDSGVKRNQDAGWLGSDQRITVSHFATTVKVLKRGLAFAWLPYEFVAAEVERGELVRLNLSSGESRDLNIFLIQAHVENQGPAVKLMSELLMQSPRATDRSD